MLKSALWRASDFTVQHTANSVVVPRAIYVGFARSHRVLIRGMLDEVPAGLTPFPQGTSSSLLDPSEDSVLPFFCRVNDLATIAGAAGIARTLLPVFSHGLSQDGRSRAGRRRYVADPNSVDS